MCSNRKRYGQYFDESLAVFVGWFRDRRCAPSSTTGGRGDRKAGRQPQGPPAWSRCQPVGRNPKQFAGRARRNVEGFRDRRCAPSSTTGVGEGGRAVGISTRSRATCSITGGGGGRRARQATAGAACLVPLSALSVATRSSPQAERGGTSRWFRDSRCAPSSTTGGGGDRKAGRQPQVPPTCPLSACRSQPEAARRPSAEERRVVSRQALRAFLNHRGGGGWSGCGDPTRSRGDLLDLRRGSQPPRTTQTRTSIFPVLSPRDRPRNASTALSIPSTTVSRQVRDPSATQAPARR
jgi:hypothetical protein